MTLLEKCQIAKQKGYTYDSLTGIVYGIRGNPIKKYLFGYIIICFRYEKKQYYLRAHHFAWFMCYGNVDFELLDHFNQKKDDNRIENLRKANNKLNHQNKLKTTKGYSWAVSNNKWQAKIGVNGKTIHIGYFDTKEEALEAYLNSKKMYHTDYCTNFEKD